MIDCIKVEPATGDGRVVLVPGALKDEYDDPRTGFLAVWASRDRPGSWCSVPNGDNTAVEYHPTPEAAAAHLGARLPDATLPDLDTPAAGDQPTARERELMAQVEAQALQLRRCESARAGWSATDRVLCDVAEERVRQDAKWGVQNHPNGTGPGLLRDVVDTGTTADAAKGHCGRMFAEGRGTYLDILWEELAEAAEETDNGPLRAELVQVAAVAVQWIEKIDREGA